jgi:hypothetical protein
MNEIIFPRSPYSLALQRPAHEVVTLLEQATTMTSFSDHFRPRLVGRFEGPEIILRRANPWSKDAGVVQFRGHLSDDGRRIDGWFEPTFRIRLFAAFWLGILAFMFVPVQVAQTRREGMTSNNLLLWFVLIAFIGVGFLLPWLTLKTSRSDRNAVVAALTAAAGVPAA